MSSRPRRLAFLGAVFATACAPNLYVLTYHYDNARTGQNIHETKLTPTTVKSSTFGRLFSQSVDGDIHAQPLYMENLQIPGMGARNVIFVATEKNQVDAFDAGGGLLWVANLNGSGSPIPASQVYGCSDITPYVGITGTPVIDVDNGVLNVVAATMENGAAIQRLHVLDMATGVDKFPAVTIPTAVPGTAVPFDPLAENQRAGLLLSNGLLYIAWSSHCDGMAWHGWIMAYRTLSNAPPSFAGFFNTTPTGSQGGIWMEGTGLAADSNGNLFVAIGNGDGPTGGPPTVSTNYGDSFVKLSPTLVVQDYFTPWNQAWMTNGYDADLGSGGVLLLPDQPGSHPHVLVQAGKQAGPPSPPSGGSTKLYVVDRDQMTATNQHFCATCTTDLSNIVNELINPVTNTAIPVYWNGTVYLHGDQDVLHSYAVSSLLVQSPVAAPTHTSTDGVYSGVISVSADKDHGGVVWSIKTDDSPAGGPGQAILKAYDASDLHLLYSSDADTRDCIGTALHFTTAVVAKGKVFVGASGRLAVFGLCDARRGVACGSGGTIQCDGSCGAVSDPNNCGSCGSVCGPNLVCVNGTCGTCSSSGPPRDGHPWCGQSYPTVIECACPAGQTCGPICQGDLCSVDWYCQAAAGGKTVTSGPGRHRTKPQRRP